MGSDMSCPCNRPNFYDEEEIENKDDIMNKVMHSKLTQNEIIIEFQDEQTKVCLIKTYNIEEFFNNRNLLKVSVKKESSKYYNSVLICNYLGKSEYSLIVLQDNPFKYKLNREKEKGSIIENTISSTSKSSLLDTTGKYMVESINLVSTQFNKIEEHILHTLSTNLKKNYYFVGLVNDSPITNRKMNMLFKLGFRKEETIGYKVHSFDCTGILMNEDRILDVLNDSQFNTLRLKTIGVDSVNYTESEMKTIIKKSKDISKTNLTSKLFYNRKNIQFYL